MGRARPAAEEQGSAPQSGRPICTRLVHAPPQSRRVREPRPGSSPDHHPRGGRNTVAEPAAYAEEARLHHALALLWRDDPCGGCGRSRNGCALFSPVRSATITTCRARATSASTRLVAAVCRNPPVAPPRPPPNCPAIPPSAAPRQRAIASSKRATATSSSPPATALCACFTRVRNTGAAGRDHSTALGRAQHPGRRSAGRRDRQVRDAISARSRRRHVRHGQPRFREGRVSARRADGA
jgi:hypothetical protein